MGRARREGLDKAFGSPSTVITLPQFTQGFLSGSTENPSPRSRANWDSWLPYIQGPLHLLIYPRLPLQPGQPALWTLRCQVLHNMWAWRDLWVEEGPQAGVGEYRLLLAALPADVSHMDTMPVSAWDGASRYLYGGVRNHVCPSL